MYRYLIIVSILLLSACQDSAGPELLKQDHRYNDITSGSVTDAGVLLPGEINRFVFHDWVGPKVPVWAYVPQGVNTSKAPILVMMHGAKRDPHRYLREWRPLAQENGIIVVAPEFSKEDFPNSAGYNLGNVFRIEGVDLQDEAVWSFSAIEPIFDVIVKAVNSEQTAYTMYGHSAGSQFVHRYLYYKPEARVKRYIAANAGWYTLPDMSTAYPYGLKGAEVSEVSLKLALGKDVITLLGDQDNDSSHKSLRRTPEAMLQGEHRFARGLSFHQIGRQQAQALQVPYGWKRVIVEGVAHSNGGMAEGAISLIE